MTKTLSTPIVIPEAVRRKAGLRRGDRVEFRISGRAITITPTTPSTDDRHPAAERRAINRGIAQSEKERLAGLAAGPFETHEDFIAALRAPAVKPSRRKAGPRR